MRVTSNSINSIMLNQLNDLMARQARLQNQVSSGQRIQNPEDDPAGMGQALNLQNQSDLADQYASNISTLQSRSSTVSDAFLAIKRISDRAGEIATQAVGTASPQNMQAMAVEVRQLIQQAVQLANTQDGDQYVFAGTNNTQAPFSAITDASGNVTAVNYQGNSGVVQTEIAEGTTLAVESPGLNNSGTGPRGALSDNRYGADLFNHLIALQNHLLAGNAGAISSTDQPALRSDEDNLIYQTASNGVIQARLETAASDTNTRKAGVQQALTNVAGADLATTLVQLSQTQNAYQAALQSSAKLLELQQNLLSYLPV